MAKANKDGWIRHRGGKCPVEKGTLIDVVYRDGVENLGVSACTGFTGSVNRSAERWDHFFHYADIMRWRLHKPEIEQSVVEVAVDGPLDWRDRIRQIAAEEAKCNEEHRQAIEALEEERVSLVQKLEAEDLKLIESNPACDGMPAEDMSDWRNWRVGDILEVVGEEFEPTHPIGYLAHITKIEGEKVWTSDSTDEYPSWLPGKKYMSYCKWHSRP